MTICYLVIANPDGGFKPRRRLAKNFKKYSNGFHQPPSGSATADGVLASIKYIERC